MRRRTSAAVASVVCKFVIVIISPIGSDWQTIKLSKRLILVSNKTSELVMSKIRGRLENCPRGLRLSITFDKGSEFARWQWLKDLLHVEIYFAHPHSPWERGTNENTNGLVRQCFPKGTPISLVNHYQVQDVQEKPAND